MAGDRLSGFTEVFFTPAGTTRSGARGLISCLREWFRTFGVPEQLSSDGGTEFTADATREFLKKWGVSHRISSAYHPQSNGRAEVAVKAAKRMLRTNVTSGTLNTDKFLLAMLQLRNTPDPDCGISPAEIVFGRRLRDNLKFSSYTNRCSYSGRWQQAWTAKEDALRTRFARTAEKLNAHVRALCPLTPGESCFIQNQTGNSKKKWHQTGTVMEVLPYDQYVVKVDGSGRLTTRNRRFLRKYTPFSTHIPASDGFVHDETWTKRGNDTSIDPNISHTTQHYPDDIVQGDRSDQVPLTPARNTNDQLSHDGTGQAQIATPERGPTPRTKTPLCLRRLQAYLPEGAKEQPLYNSRRPVSKQ